MALWEYHCRACNIYLDVTTTRDDKEVNREVTCPGCGRKAHLSSYDRDDKTSIAARIRDLHDRLDRCEQAILILAESDDDGGASEFQ